MPKEKGVEIALADAVAGLAGESGVELIFSDGFQPRAALIGSGVRYDHHARVVGSVQQIERIHIQLQFARLASAINRAGYTQELGVAS